MYLLDVTHNFPPTNEVFFSSHELFTNVARKLSNLEGQGKICCIKHRLFYTCTNKEEVYFLTKQANEIELI